MKNKKRVFCMNLIFVFVLIAGMVLPVKSVSATSKEKKTSKKVLVVYFSGTGTTRNVAKKIKKATGAKLYQIKPEEPYTSEDLDYSNDNCRANVEQQDETVRPKIDGKVKNIKKYDVIFLGYPIWWGKDPMIIQTFLESYNLEDKKIVPFCTSGGSGISGSMKGIEAAAKGAKVVEGKDLTDLSSKDIAKWAKNKVK